MDVQFGALYMADVRFTLRHIDIDVSKTVFPTQYSIRPTIGKYVITDILACFLV